MLNTKNRTLYIIIAILLVALIVMIVKTNIKGERTFRKSLCEFNPEDIDKIEIVDNNSLIKFIKDGAIWRVAKDAESYKADIQTVESILKDLSTMNIQRVVSRDKSKLQENEIDDSLGTRIKLFSKNKQLTDLVIGRFSYRQTGQGGIQLSTMVRLANEYDVYSIEGSLSMSVRRDFDGFRDKTIAKFDPENVQNIEFSYPADSSFTLTRSGDIWLINQDTVEIGKVVNYLNDIKDARANAFATDFNPENAELFELKATFSGEQPLTIKAFKQGEKYLFLSAQNESTLSDSEHIFRRLFVSKNKFAK
ncbi:MAG TPA: DUF4340 domain-containing protein [Salinivirgaceae bacterium]|nr:DUF4340 domain-containing protein [Salinivirgaceae bacterium]